MPIEVVQKCRDYGQRPECLGDIDERYTMDFSDVGEGCVIYWCSFCGPPAHALDKALMEFMAASPENVQKVKDALDKVECTHRMKQS